MLGSGTPQLAGTALVFWSVKTSKHFWKISHIHIIFSEKERKKLNSKVTYREANVTGGKEQP